MSKGRRSTLARKSSVKGRRQRMDRRLASTPESTNGMKFHKPGSENPRKTGR